MLFPSLHQTQIPYGSRVLVRASLNVPLQDGEVASTFRIQRTSATIKLLLDWGARVTVVSHFGREGASLAPVHKFLTTLLPISFIPQIVGEAPYNARKNLQPGEAVLLENTRIDPREEQNDDLFTEELAAQTDVFVFDDFSAAHREHSSTVGLIAALPSYAGMLFYEEVAAVFRLTARLEKPAMAIISGAKCKTKIPLLTHLLDSYEVVFVGGVLANTILQQRGYSVGASKVDNAPVPESILHNRKIILPQDVMIDKRDFDVQTVPMREIESADVIVDVGDQTLKAMQYHLENAKTVFLNGPLGWYEKGFFGQTLTLSHLVKKSRAHSFTGGGETVALLEQHDLLEDWNFVSTGGGSLLTYLSEGTLSVIEAFKRKIAAPAVPIAQDNQMVV